jgi:hypothetical protein
MRSALAAALLTLLFSGAARAGPPTAPTPTRTMPASPRRPPLDFTGIWELDASASQGVPRAMHGAVLSVTQTGHRITIEPVHGDHILLSADQIVADGRTYEKAVGPKMKGLVTASWSPRRDSLHLEITAGTPEDPKQSVQRSVWTISKDRKVWVRQSVTVRNGETSLARLVFRRRMATTPTPTPKDVKRKT